MSSATSLKELSAKDSVFARRSLDYRTVVVMWQGAMNTSGNAERPMSCGSAYPF